MRLRGRRSRIISRNRSVSPSVWRSVRNTVRCCVGLMVQAYPSSSGKITALNAPIQPSTGGADAVYISDLAILPEARGAGVTHAVIDRLVRLAREDGFRVVTLVAVNNSTGFWVRHGFQVQERPDARKTLTSYGDDARFMVRDLVLG